MRKLPVLMLALAMHALPAASQQLFWELPVVKAAAGVSYSSSAANDELLALSWQERTGSGSTSAVTIWMDTARLAGAGIDTRWAGRRLVYGPIPLVGAGEEPRMHSLAIDDRRIMVAIVLPSMTGAEGSEILITSSEDGGETFRDIARFRAATVVTSPDLSHTSDGGWLLMLTQPEEIVGERGQATQGKLSIAFSTSSDGERWSELKPMVTEPALTQNIQPYHVVFGKTDVVVFQSKRVTNHLYVKRSDDGGRTWDTPAVPITSGDGFAEAAAGKARVPDDFNNQRPYLIPLGDRLGLAWERAIVGSDQSQIYYCEIDAEGRVVRPKEQVSRGGSALYPQLVSIQGGLRLLYAEKQLKQQARMMLASRTTGDGPGAWSAIPVGAKLESGGLVPHGAILKDRLFVFAEALSGKTWTLYAIRPDTSAPPPSLRPLDFAQGAPANRTRISVGWDEPTDPSKITGYRISWGIDGGDEKTADLAGPSQQLSLDVPEDGTWTLAVWSIDGAGNVSREPARLRYIRDATPPGPVALFLQPAPQLDGYQPSNDFTISWTPSPEERVARYVVSAPLPADGGRIQRQPESLRAENVDDGVYAVEVSAVDLAGNIGQPTVMTIRLNRYRPVTYIGRVDTRKNDGENLVLQLVGRGFTSGGTVPEVYLDRDGLPPYDYTLSREARQFEVPDDRHVQGITLGADYDTAEYRVGVRHPVRGVHFAAQTIAFQAPGTVKIGDFSFRWLPRWAAARTSRWHVPFVSLLGVLFAGLVAVLLVVSSRRLVATAREGVTLKAEVLALLEGRPSLLTVEETERKLRTLHRRGIGLRLKFSLLVSILAVMIVAGVAVPLGRKMLSDERRILAEQLMNRANLLLDSAAARAAAPMRPKNEAFATVTNIPASTRTMPREARYLTITGSSVPASVDPVDRDYLWATNDPSWPEGSFVPARLPIEDEVLKRAKVSEIARSLNADAGVELKDQLARGRELSAEIDRLAKISIGRGATAEDVKAYEDRQREYEEVQAESRSRLQALAKQGDRTGTIPAFEADRPEPSYLFYRPVVDFVLDGNFTLGMVRLSISTEQIQEEIAKATRDLISAMGVISLAAVVAGIVLAVILAGITIGPVRKLAAGVAKIRDTDDKSQLEEIPIGSRDEIGTLADAVNDMTRGLVRAAKDKAELLVGKGVQKRFLPLEEVGGEKGSTGGRRTDRLDIYGYYEGAKGVSGDYFDFQQLDERTFAIINCDVAGKGVPAAMIMVEVATLFLGWCREWSNGSAGTGLDALVYTINDMLEERGFKGRFAALTVALFDLETGLLTVCTAGSNVLHVYDADRKSILQHPLPQTPAAGVFASVLVQAKSGFPQLKLPLDRGDALFLFTDGFEESKRSFRNYAGDVVACAEPGLKEGELHAGNHACGQTSEEFGIPRITAVVNAVFGRGDYRLERHHVVSREDLVFDFSGCTGTVKEAVLALVCVEKVFRIYRDASTGRGDRIHMEAKVNEFLRKHFRQYDELFDHPLEGGKEGVTFSHLKEDPQYDDLTLLVLRRP